MTLIMWSRSAIDSLAWIQWTWWPPLYDAQPAASGAGWVSGTGMVLRFGGGAYPSASVDFPTGSRSGCSAPPEAPSRRGGVAGGGPEDLNATLFERHPPVPDGRDIRRATRVPRQNDTPDPADDPGRHVGASEGRSTRTAGSVTDRSCQKGGRARRSRTLRGLLMGGDRRG